MLILKTEFRSVLAKIGASNDNYHGLAILLKLCGTDKLWLSEESWNSHFFLIRTCQLGHISIKNLMFTLWLEPNLRTSMGCPLRSWIHIPTNLFGGYDVYSNFSYNSPVISNLWECIQAIRICCTYTNKDWSKDSQEYQKTG